MIVQVVQQCECHRIVVKNVKNGKFYLLCKMHFTTIKK